jgi:hypothetical protein
VSTQEAAQFAVTTPEETSEKHKSSSKVEKLASWFDGASDPVRISMVPSPSKEASNSISLQGNMERLFSASTESVDSFTKRSQKKPPLSSTLAQNSGRFSFFRKTSQAQIKSDPIAQDELAQLDIRSALFPTGIADEFSPAAFKNLQMNAEGTLYRLQDAYRDNLRELKAVRSEKNIQADELEAAQTRNEHLKLQLTEMAKMATEQEKTITALREELAIERKRIERQNIRMVTSDSYISNEGPITPMRQSYRKKRISDMSTSNESETGSELSSVESVFSEPMVGEFSPGSSVTASPVLKSAIMFKPSTCPSKGLTPVQVLECGKCHGLKPSEAWDVISVLKMESMALKERIEELEGAQEDALDFVNGLRLSAGG